MPDPKEVTQGTLVDPADPAAAVAAVTAQAGSVTKAEDTATQEAEPWKTDKLKPYKPPDKQTKEEKETKTSWIEIAMVDESDEPVPGEPYVILLADGATYASGTLDEKGKARIDGIDPGTCQVIFPELDKDAWKKA